MTDTLPTSPAIESASDGSLRGRVATRRSELRDQRPIELDVPGYKGILRARYRTLDYPAVRAIGERHKNVRSRPEAELKIAADTLCAACDCLLAVSEDGAARETQFRWDWETARKLFEIPAGEVPDDALPRVALQRIVPHSTALMLHYAEYDSRSRGVDDEVAEEIQGEFEAA